MQRELSAVAVASFSKGQEGAFKNGQTVYFTKDIPSLNIVKGQKAIIRAYIPATAPSRRIPKGLKESYVIEGFDTPSFKPDLFSADPVKG